MKSLAKVAVSFALMQKKEERKIAASSESPHVRQCQASFSLLSLNRAFQDYGSRWRTSRRSAKSSELASLKQQSFLNASLLLPFAVEPKVDHSFLRNDAVAKIVISNNFLEPRSVMIETHPPFHRYKANANPDREILVWGTDGCGFVGRWIE